MIKNISSWKYHDTGRHPLQLKWDAIFYLQTVVYVQVFLHCFCQYYNHSYCPCLLYALFPALQNFQNLKKKKSTHQTLRKEEYK